jgi:hypothetical protein
MPDGVIDERGFNFLRRLREEAGKGVPLAAFKDAVREQFLMLLLDERRCIEAIPGMIATDAKLAARLSETLHDVIDVVGLSSPQAKARLSEIEGLLQAAGMREPARSARREMVKSGAAPALETRVSSNKHT